MKNVVFIEVYTKHGDLQRTSTIDLPLESFITYCIYKRCCPDEVSLKFVFVDKMTGNKITLKLTDDSHYVDITKVPWQVASCLYPVVLFEDTIITGLCAVARHICKFKSHSLSSVEHEEGILGFRKSCLQAPNEASIWTKFCEIDLLKTVKDIVSSEKLQEIPQNLVRFENHLKKPVKVHNVYKMARNLKKINLKKNIEVSSSENLNKKTDTTRSPKTRKWKSNAKKELEIDSSTKIEDLNINHEFAEGPFLTLADLVLLPSYHIIIASIGDTIFESILPVTYKWYKNIINISEMGALINIINDVVVKSLLIEDILIPTTEDVSLYKCDPKRSNPKRRIFTKENDIENALNCLMEGMELNTSSNEFDSGIDWKIVPDGANPLAGHLPDERMVRKSQQLENLALAVLSIAKSGDLIVDFCSGSGHLGILVAYLLPKCTVILLENKEQSLLRARTRVYDMGLRNVYFFQCNLDFFTGKFDIGIALHACGIASDLVLDKCLNSKAKFILCPCCYGSLHITDRLAYPRSEKFKGIAVDQYLCIGHAADQTHDEHPLTVRGDRCMAVIDSDRGRLAEESGYKVSLSRLKPLSCTPKNNLLIGVPT